MNEELKLSVAIVRRLPLYYRYLTNLLTKNKSRISSKKLGELMGLTASQIRQDINSFGGVGQQGYGYDVAMLQARIGEVLGIGRERNMIVVGSGNIGRAIASYVYFEEAGFKVIGIFDADSYLFGKKVGNLQVESEHKIEAFLENNVVDIGVITTPGNIAVATAKRLVENGVKAIWNFAPVDMFFEDVAVQSVQLADSLFTLSYYMNNKNI